MVQALAPAGLRRTCSRWSKSRNLASKSVDGISLSKSHPGAWEPTRVLVFLAAKVLLFSLLAATATSHSSARARAARALPARAVRSSYTVPTTAVRGLLESSGL